MQLLAAIVDKLPERCSECDFNFLAHCALTDEVIYKVTRMGIRHKKCPLLTAEQWTGEWRARLAELKAQG